MTENSAKNQQPPIWQSIQKQLSNSWSHIKAALKPTAGSSSPLNTRLVWRLMLCALAGAVMISTLLWWLDSNYRPLYGLGENYNTAAIIEVLDQQGIEYRINPDSGQLMVQQKKVPAARMAMATSGIIIKDSMLQQELPQKEMLGNSHFMEQLHYIAALETSLSNTIVSLVAVRNVRVHLAVPERTVFFRQEPEAKASVYLDLYSGSALKAEQVEAIMRLVSGSVTGLEERQVTVVDQYGNLLSQPVSSELEFSGRSAAQKFLLARVQIENHLELQLAKILDAIVGAGNYRVDVAADLTVNKEELNSERFGPDTVIRSESIQTDVSQAVAGDQTAPATPSETGNTQQQANQENNEQKVVRNYEVTREVSNVVRYPGEIKRLSIAVAIDASAFNKLPPSQGQAKLTGLIKQAVGFNGTRGDEVSLAVLPFTIPPEPGPEPQSLPQTIESWLMVVVQILTVIAIILFTFFGWRWFKKSNYPASEVPTSTRETRDSGIPSKSAAPVQGLESHLAQLRTMSIDEPEKAASVIKRWISSNKSHA